MKQWLFASSQEIVQSMTIKSSLFKMRQGVNSDSTMDSWTGKVISLEFSAGDGSLAIAHRLLPVTIQMATMHVEVNIDDQSRRCTPWKSTMNGFASFVVWPIDVMHQ